jgi:hypothetical protein
MNGINAARLNTGLARGRAYIFERRSENGMWRDFRTLAGESSDWVTAFVWYATVAPGPSDPYGPLPPTALIGRQQVTGGWGYNGNVPPDADSTAWTLLALSAMPSWRPSAVLRGLRYLRLHQRSCGGFSTYAPQDKIEGYIEAPAELTLGWLQAHCCVTGVAVQALLANGVTSTDRAIEGALAFLKEKREADGLWRSYWWLGAGYASYHALRALAWSRALSASERALSASALIERQSVDGSFGHSMAATSSFETAWSALALLLASTPVALESAARAISWLLAAQQRNGSWPEEPILRIPPPTAATPDEISDWRVDELGTGVVIADQRSLFTSASVLWALAVAEAMLAPSRAHKGLIYPLARPRWRLV